MRRPGPLRLLLVRQRRVGARAPVVAERAAPAGRSRTPFIVYRTVPSNVADVAETVVIGVRAVSSRWPLSTGVPVGSGPAEEKGYLGLHHGADCAPKEGGGDPGRAFPSLPVRVGFPRWTLLGVGPWLPGRRIVQTREMARARKDNR